MDKIRTGIRLFQAAIVLILLICSHSILTVFSSFISEDQVDFRMHEEVEGYTMFEFSAEPKNNGFLPVSLRIDLQVLSESDQELTSNSTSVRISPGGSGKIHMSLRIPSNLLKEGEENNGGSLHVKVNAGTLGDLFSLTNILKVGGNIEA